MATGHATITPRKPGEPKFSALSHHLKVRGADWPEWQRHLHPVTYALIGDREHVERRLAGQQREAAWARACLHRMLKQGDRKAAARYREHLDRHLTYVRNCETQLRLIDAANEFLASQKVAA